MPRRVGSVEQLEVLASCLNRVDQKLVAAVETKNHDLQKAALGIEPQAQLTRRTVFVQVADLDGMLRGMDGAVRIDSVPARGVVDFHAT